MNTYRRWFQNFLAGSAFVLAALAWIFFAPAAVGGQTDYVMINGNSMEPGFHTGDLVIVRQALNYQVGDIVTYRDPDLGRFVFHRIVGFDLDRYIFKGDNNAWTDSYRPTAKELIGKLWIFIPGAGSVVQWVRIPLNVALIVGGIGVMIMAPVFFRSNKKQNKSKKSVADYLSGIKDWFAGHLIVKNGFHVDFKALGSKLPRIRLPKPGSFKTPPVPNRDQSAKNLSGLIEGSIFILGLLFFTTLVLGFFAFTAPLWRTVQDNIQYQHTGAFSYSATAPSGVYDTQAIGTGEPIFPKLTCQVNLNFNYKFLGDQVQNLAGTHQLSALVIENTSGWQRSIQLEPPTPFTGNAYSSSASINLCQVEALADSLEVQTEIHPFYYSLVIVPHVDINGKVPGANLKDTFEPRLVFQFDKLHVYLLKDETKSDPLYPSQAGLIKSPRIEPNTLQFLGLKPEVSKMRTLSAAGFGLSLIGLLLLGWYLSKMARRSQAAFIRVKYGSLLVDVNERALNLSMPEVDVVAIDDLAKLAERNNSMILHEAQGLTHDYFVPADQMTFHYVINEIENRTLIVSPMQRKKDLRQAIERDEFKVYYQPIVSLSDRKIIAVEALLRWQHPQNGLVSAKEFIPAAEKTGLIDTIGEWMLQVACTQIKVWQEAGVPLKLAINLSERQLERGPDRIIARALQSTGLDPTALQVEVPATSAFENRAMILPNLQALKKLGIQISVDNYSGNFPLSSLSQFPFNTIKIDRAMLEKVNNPQDAETIHGMISSALSQGLNVIAEGVETEEQLNFLRTQLCTQAQGYLLGRPAPAEELTLLFQDREISSASGLAKRRSRSKVVGL